MTQFERSSRHSSDAPDVRLLVTEFDLDAIDDSWESLVSAAIPIVEAHDRNRWTLGDLGCKVERKYGESSLAKYAREIHLRSTSIMYDYTAVSRFYSIEDRATFPTLTWSHFRAALAAETRELALTWLAKAADEEWSVEELQEAIRVKNGGDPKPQKLVEIGGQFWECRPVVNEGSDEITGYDVVFRVASAVDVLIPRQVYTVKVFGEKSRDDD